MNGDAIRVHVRQALQEVHAAQLVLHFGNAELPVDDLLEGLAPIVATMAVEREDDVPALGRVQHPQLRAAKEGIGHELHVRAIVDVDDDRVFFPRVEAGRLHQAPVEHVAVLALHAHELNSARAHARERVLAVHQCLQHGAIRCANDLRAAGDGETAPRIGQVSAIDTELPVVRARLLREPARLPACQLHPVDVRFQRARWALRVDDGRTLHEHDGLLRVEAEDILHYPCALGELPHKTFLQVVQVKMPEAVLLAPPDEVAGCALQEGDRMLRFQPLRVPFFKDRSQGCPGDRIILHEAQVVTLWLVCPAMG